MIIDTHVHIIHRNELRYSWLADAPALDKDATHDEYRNDCRALGITHALHMEVDVEAEDIEAETRMIERLISEGDTPLVGAIAACRPESDGFAAYLERQADNPVVKGFRRVLHVVPDNLSGSALFHSNIKLLSNTPYVFDLCVFPHQMPTIMKLVDACPNVQFVLDHCGNPGIRDAQLAGSHDPLPEPWASSMRAMADRPNVSGKVSGVMAYCDGANWTVDDLRPYVEHTIDCFGWDRVIWGSDRPVCTLGGSLGDWVATSKILVSACSQSEQERLFYKNANRLWQLGMDLEI